MRRNFGPFFSLLAALLCLAALLGACRAAQGVKESPLPSPPAQTPGQTPPFHEIPLPQGLPGELCEVAGVEEFLSLRVSDQSSAVRVRKLPGGCPLLVLERHGDFARVLTEGGERGYVMSAYLRPSSLPFTLPAAEAGAYTVVCRSSLSLFEAPSLQAERIGRIAPGSGVTLLGEAENGFARILSPDLNAEGYALLSYLSFGRLNDPEPPDAFLSPSPSPGASAGSNPSRSPSPAVPSASAQPSPSPVKTQGTSPKPGEDGRPELFTASCSQYLSLRERPSSDAPSLCQIANGAEVKLLSYTGAFAKVSYRGVEGYVLAGYLKPQDRSAFKFTAVQPKENYSYAQMMGDIQALEEQYPGRLRAGSIGQSALGKGIPLLILGEASAKTTLLVTAGIHGREHMTSLLLMAQIDRMLAEGGPPAGVSYHVLPMLNPDGVQISQGREMTPALRAIYEADRAAGFTSLGEKEYLARWKANANGIDLNRNFARDFGKGAKRNGPSSSLYPGASPEDQPESRALGEYLRSHKFKASLHFHAYGSWIYGQYGSDETLNRLSLSLAERLSALSGYPLSAESGEEGGGLKDYLQGELKLPSVTIEIGTRACPLPFDEFYTIWLRNEGILRALGDWAAKN
ncbi:MAG: SH3 domain-containing protein [Christensenellaceae bacterium]|jgi:g-D-glutamyl-meso-diaminopimelate peptidase|nr:SH3 domain-containing protein [Christensenellaceae bacterium]